MQITKLERKKMREKGFPVSYIDGGTESRNYALERVRAEIQRDLQDFVGREIYVNCSQHMSELRDTHSGSDEWLNLHYRQPTLDDYRDQAPEDLVVFNRYGDRWDYEYEGELAEGFDSELEAYQNAFRCHGGDDPEGSEVFEHWIVSDWLADKLEAHGEVVNKDFLGLTIWGRCTTGQMIAMDGVIERIYEEVQCK